MTPIHIRQDGILHNLIARFVKMGGEVEDYTAKGIPVMVWATTDMQEPYVFNTWTVDYVDEDAQAAMGEKVSWYMHEHCLVLIGYDENEYYFADSSAGAVSHFDKELVKQRYEQLFSQSIVVK